MTKLEIISRLLNLRPGSTDNVLKVFKSHYAEMYTLYTTSDLTRYDLTGITDLLYNSTIEKRMEKVLEEE